MTVSTANSLELDSSQSPLQDSDSYRWGHLFQPSPAMSVLMQWYRVYCWSRSNACVCHCLSRVCIGELQLDFSLSISPTIQNYQDAVTEPEVGDSGASMIVYEPNNKITWVILLTVNGLFNRMLWVGRYCHTGVRNFATDHPRSKKENTNRRTDK